MDIEKIRASVKIPHGSHLKQINQLIVNGMWIERDGFDAVLA